MTDTQLARMPIGTESHTATLKSGLSMRWFEKGEGRPVILLHGFPELAVSWKAQFATLADHYRVIAPDLRGYGYTDAPKKVSAYHLSTLVQDVVELADALHIEDFHLAGHDWGGTIAWEAAMEHPKRIRSVAVLNSIPPRLLIREMCRPDQLMRSWYMFFFQIPFLPESRLCADPESTSSSSGSSFTVRAETTSGSFMM